MTKRTGPTSTALKSLISELKRLSIENKTPLWKRVASELERPRRIRRQVNIYKINKHTRENETAIVPGKVLSEGELTKKLTIAAYQFSGSAKAKINRIGKAITIKDLLRQNPKGNNVRISG